MSPAHVLEPTYRRLKRAIMDGSWRGGAKLEAQRLADEYGVSMTPVRDSLNQLAGEGLVDLTPGEGFRVAMMTEKMLREMLEVNAALLKLANPTRSRLPAEALEIEPDVGYADRVAAIFSRLSSASDNRFLSAMVDHISVRLHVVRLGEPAIVPDASQLISELETSLGGPASRRRVLIERYHRRSQDAVPELVARISN